MPATMTAEPTRGGTLWLPSVIICTYLVNKDAAVHLEEVSALHSGAAGLGTNEEGPVSILEDLLGGDANGNLRHSEHRTAVSVSR